MIKNVLDVQFPAHVAKLLSDGGFSLITALGKLSVQTVITFLQLANVLCHTIILIYVRKCCT